MDKGLSLQVPQVLRPLGRNKETFEAGVEQTTGISEGNRVRSHRLIHAGL